MREIIFNELKGIPKIFGIVIMAFFFPAVSAMYIGIDIA